MLFTTDKQTLEDLNIFGKHGSNSVFTLFNRCTTRGGAAVLEEMFRYPLADDTAINRRSSIIRFFAEETITFPFQPVHFDAVDTYLANKDERTRLQAEEPALGKKLEQLIATDTETANIIRGITAICTVLQETRLLLQSVSTRCPDAWLADTKAMEAILNDPAFSVVWQYQRQKMPRPVMATLDTIFRFRHRNLLEKLLRYIYHLDVYLSVAAVASEKKWAFPQALPKQNRTVFMEAVYHPQVSKAVPNSLHITPDGNVIFLTGANMAGKSTFMKSVSIALFLAHMGFPVAASRMQFAVFEGIYTTINLPDNLGLGASHFYAEVLRVKKMAQELAQNKRLFIVFDELFRGTNVKDAYEATVAIVTGFAGRKNSAFIISTHIIEAGDTLKEKAENIRYLFLPTHMNGNKPVYTYQIEEGITADRHGMVILNNERVIDILKQGSNEFRNR